MQVCIIVAPRMKIKYCPSEIIELITINRHLISINKSLEFNEICTGMYNRILIILLKSNLSYFVGKGPPLTPRDLGLWLWH